MPDMDLSAFWRSLGDEPRKHVENIKLLTWYSHVYLGRQYLTASDVRDMFESLGVAPPSSIGPFIEAMASKRPPEVLKKSNTFRLEARVQAAYDAKYGQRPNAVYVTKLLSDLSEKLPVGAERTYLDEAVICFKNGAFRASIVMAWNLAYDHLCVWILKKHLGAFNAQIPIRFPKLRINIINRDDFSEMKEAEVIAVCGSCGIINGSLQKILEEKLKRRNMSAHPSGIGIFQPTAEEVIKDLVENVVLKLN